MLQTIFTGLIFAWFVFLIIAAIVFSTRDVARDRKDTKSRRKALPERLVDVTTNQNRHGNWGWVVQLWDGRKMHHMNCPSYQHEQQINRTNDTQADALHEALRYIKERGYSDAPEVCFLNSSQHT